jgi:hypothetical protein
VAAPLEFAGYKAGNPTAAAGAKPTAAAARDKTDIGGNSSLILCVRL